MTISLSDARAITFLDTNLLSGSGEKFRSAIGSYWDINSSSAEGEVLGFGESNDAYIYNGNTVTYNLPLDPRMKSFDFNMSLMEELAASDNTLAPAYKFPVRIVGEPNVISNDLDWKDIVMGGTYMETQYPGFFSYGTYDSTRFQYYAPYGKKEAKLLRGADNSSPEPSYQIEIGYNYQNHIEEYEAKVATLGTETLIPNLYFFEIFKGQSDNLADPNGAHFDVNPYVVDFANLGILTNEELSTLYTPVISSILPHFQLTIDDLTTDTNTGIPNSTEYIDKTRDIRTYLSATYAQGSVPASAETELPRMLTNILLDDKVFESGGLIENMEADASKFPYYIKLAFPIDSNTQLSESPTEGSLKDSIKNNDFSQKFIKTLKEAFLQEASDIPIENIEIVRYEEHKTADWSADPGKQLMEKRVANTTSMRAIDLPQFLMSCYNNYNAEIQDCYFLGEVTDLRAAAMSNDNTQRYANTTHTLGVLEYVNTLLQTTTYDYNGELHVAGGDIFPSLLYRTNSDGKQVGLETLAYRIEKRGGSPNPSGDLFTSAPLQNYWIFNPEQMPGTTTNNMKIYDSQIKYGVDYSYQVYAYVAVVGQKYQYEDLRISRQIGQADTDSDGTADQYCLEFYDPQTGETAGQFYDAESTLEAAQQYAPSATDAHYIGTDEYLVDFNLTYSPTIKIVEVPLYAKSLKVMDNPGSRLDVIPYQVMDDSQSIGFVLNYEFFVSNHFPFPLTPADAQSKVDYENANDFVPGEKVTLGTVSNARYVQVYRMSTKPKNLSDFADHFYDQIDLRIPDSKATHSVTNFVDKIQTNSKYYYLFRVLNEHMLPSHVSEIYESELVNDGGYKYATFNTLFEQDLQEEIFTQPSRFFKKLIHLRPNISHLVLNTEEVDFADAAHSQLSNLSVGESDDVIWGKTFKIRMTSKKTGKKIDLNITYNLENEQ